MNQTNKSFHKFLALWAGELISAIGSGLTSFGLGVFVYSQTGQAAAMTLVTLLAFLPTVLLSPVAGILADRYDRRLLMLLGDGLSALGLVFIVCCMFFTEITLWQICVGVTISSIFSALLEPSYRATITDLLTEEEFSKASGLVQVAGSSKYLISPILAGILLTIADIKLLLLIDICTFFFTVTVILFVRKGITSSIQHVKQSFIEDMKEGIAGITEKKGIIVLVTVGSLLTFFLAVIQTLSTPMILAFSDVNTLGITETLCATGMLVSSLILGLVPVKKSYVKILSGSLLGAGLSMMLFGFQENIVLICVAGFLFFAMLPFANMGIDVLVRKNVANEVQGRVWGMIGILSQLGYIIAYAILGILADKVFTPLLMEQGTLSKSVGKVIGVGTGRGIAFMIVIAGLAICVLALLLAQVKSVKELERADVS